MRWGSHPPSSPPLDRCSTCPLRLNNTVLEALHEKVKPFGLQVSWPQNKVQVFGGLPDESVLPAHVILEIFVYLDNAVHSDGGLSQEVVGYCGMVWPTVLWTCSTRAFNVISTCADIQRFGSLSRWWSLSYSMVVRHVMKVQWGMGVYCHLL